MHGCRSLSCFKHNTDVDICQGGGGGGLWRMVLGEKTFPLSAYLEKKNTQKNTISSMVLFQTPVWSRHYGHVNTCSVLSTPPATLLLPNQTSSSQYLFWNCNSFRLFGWQLGCRDGGFFLAGLLFSLFYGVCVWGGASDQFRLILEEMLLLSARQTKRFKTILFLNKFWIKIQCFSIVICLWLNKQRCK